MPTRWWCRRTDRIYRFAPSHCKRAVQRKEHPHRECGWFVLVPRDDALDMVGETNLGAPENEVIHHCPPNGKATMPCCGRTPFEVPRSERITSQLSEVTCMIEDDSLGDRLAAKHGIGEKPDAQEHIDFVTGKPEGGDGTDQWRYWEQQDE